jgi:hypothetical protein
MGQEIGIHVTLSGLQRYEGFTDAQRAAVRSGNAARLFKRFSGVAMARNRL